MLRQKLVDQFIQSWFSNICNSSSGEFHSSFKNEYYLEPYLRNLNKANRFLMCKFCCSKVKLPIQTGRWLNIPKQERFCEYRKTLGDEFHYCFVCKNLMVGRVEK